MDWTGAPDEGIGTSKPKTKASNKKRVLDTRTKTKKKRRRVRRRSKKVGEFERGTAGRVRRRWRGEEDGWMDLEQCVWWDRTFWAELEPEPEPEPPVISNRQYSE